LMPGCAHAASAAAPCRTSLRGGFSRLTAPTFFAQHDAQAYQPPGTPARPTAPAYARDLVGYGRFPPDPKWPGGARVAVQFVINYEEGSENCILDGDAASENLLSEIVGAQPYKGQRHMNMESLYEYGSRAGFWRLHKLFVERHMPCTVYACALALERNPEAADAMVEAGWEIASHGYRWWDYQNVDEATEREHIRLAVEVQ
jgi:peptidoglycan/xylan/chitin deacetylase (PgdA/CDA1 family)